jgi:hypothetical protein
LESAPFLRSLLSCKERLEDKVGIETVRGDTAEPVISMYGGEFDSFGITSILDMKSMFFLRIELLPLCALNANERVVKFWLRFLFYLCTSGP